MHVWWAKPLRTFSALETKPATNGSRAPTYQLQPVLKPAWPSSVTGGLKLWGLRGWGCPVGSHCCPQGVGTVEGPVGSLSPAPSPLDAPGFPLVLLGYWCPLTTVKVGTAHSDHDLLKN